MTLTILLLPLLIGFIGLFAQGANQRREQEDIKQNAKKATEYLEKSWIRRQKEEKPFNDELSAMAERLIAKNRKDLAGISLKLTVERNDYLKLNKANELKRFLKEEEFTYET